MADQVLVAPPGITRPDQFAQENIRPMAPPPRQANNLIVGGPAYFTPEGYQAPVQPQEAFMPTRKEYDPIGDQFNRPPPPPPPVPAPTPAPAPVEEPVVEPVPDIPAGAYPPYIPGVTPFPGMPDFNYLDFQGLPGPGMSSVDIDEIIKEYQDRIDAGEPEPFDSFLPTQPDPRDLPPASVGGPGGPPPDPPAYINDAMADYSPTGMSNEQLKILMDSGVPIPKADYPDFEAYLASLSAPVSTPEPEFVPPPQEPNGFFPGIDFSDFEDFDFSGLPNYKMPAPTMPTPQAQAPAPVYTPPPSRIETPQMGSRSGFDFSDLGNFNLR